ncbi:hypothetical protein MYX06_04695 [Patescibacteria group bacterium AH-259-L05]|nr:hypothetical protein [Patescibacteria group bacterium AH-259-L05]
MNHEDFPSQKSPKQEAESEQVEQSEKRFIAVGGKEIELSSAEKRFIKLAEMGTAAVAGGLTIAALVSSFVAAESVGIQPLNGGEIANIVVFSLLGTLMVGSLGFMAGKKGAEGILKLKHHLDEKWKNFKENSNIRIEKIEQN